MAKTGDGRRGDDRKHPTDLFERYQSAHWGIGAKKVHTFANCPFPDCVEMGRLLEIRMVSEKRKIELKIPASPFSILGFTADEVERLYCFIPRETQKRFEERLWVPGGPTYWLTEVADAFPGRQNEWAYPRRRVQCLGEMTHILYHTNKQGDGPSHYIHKLGEETGQRPALCVGEDGLLWIAGGNYTTPDEGITD